MQPKSSATRRTVSAGRRQKRAPGSVPEFEALWRDSIGFLTLWVVHLGRRFGLLQALADRDGPIRTRELARLCSLHEPAVATWCEAASSLRILARTGPRYSLPAKLRPLVALEDDPAYLGGQFSYLALRSLDYDAFDGLFRRGEVDRGAARHLTEASGEATTWDHTAFLTSLLPRVPGLLSLFETGARILDLGCGTGAWDLRVARRFPKSTFVGVDPDRAAIDAAKRHAESSRLGDRVAFVLGAGESIASLGPFDIIHLGEVLSAVAAKAEVLASCHRILRKGGCLVVAEGLIDERSDPHEVTNQLIRAMGLDFALLGTRFFTRAELRTLLRDSGFARARFLHVGGGLWYAVASK